MMCIGAGLLGGSAALGGLYAAPYYLTQLLAVSLMVVSVLVCEFAFNTLWDPAG